MFKLVIVKCISISIFKLVIGNCDFGLLLLYDMITMKKLNDYIYIQVGAELYQAHDKKSWCLNLTNASQS